MGLTSDAEERMLQSMIEDSKRKSEERKHQEILDAIYQIRSPDENFTKLQNENNQLKEEARQLREQIERSKSEITQLKRKIFKSAFGELDGRLFKRRNFS